jgi:hypothetical protein
MRTLCLVAVLCLAGCSPSNRPTLADTPAVQDRASVTLDVDGPSGDQHPLVCGVGRDFPAGHELAFRGSPSGELVHAVFPEGVAPPKTLDGRFVLHGHYQAVENKKRYTLKRPPKDYQYFVVSSWQAAEGSPDRKAAANARGDTASGDEAHPHVVRSMAQWTLEEFTEKEGGGFVVDIDELKKRPEEVVVAANKSGTFKKTCSKQEYVLSVRREADRWIERSLATECHPPQDAERTMVHDGVAARGKNGRIAHGDIVTLDWKHNACEITLIQSKRLFVLRIKPPAMPPSSSLDERIAYVKSRIEPLFIKQAKVRERDGEYRDVPIRERILADLFEGVDRSELDGDVCIGKLPKHFTAPKPEARVSVSAKDHAVNAGYYIWYECVGWWYDGDEIVLYFPKILFYREIEGEVPANPNRAMMSDYYRLGHNWFLLDTQ